MKKIYLLLFPLFLFSVADVYAQPTFTAQTTVDCDAGTVEVDIIVTNFTDITSFQIPVSWNTGDISFTNLDISSDIMDGGQGVTTTGPGTDPPMGILKIGWFHVLIGTGLDLADGTVIYTLQYNLVGDAADAPFISLDDQATFIQLVGTVGSAPGTLPPGAFTMSVDPTPIYIDTTPPVVTCSGDIMSGTSSVSVPNPTATDNCGIATIINDFNGTGDASGTYPNGTTTVNFTVTDLAGLTNTCSMDVTVTGGSPGTFTVTAQSQTVECSDGSITVDFVVTGTGFQDMVALEFAVGFDENLITYTGFDATLLGALSGVNAVGAPFGSIDFSWANLSGTPLDLTSGTTMLTLNFDLTETTGASDILFTTSATNPTIFFEDMTGTVSPANYTLVNGLITINDITNPVINCPADVVEMIPVGSTPPTLSIPLPTATDNCSTPTFINDFNSLADASDMYPVGSTTVVYTATDQSSNTGTCSFNVSVIETGELTLNVSTASIECNGGLATVTISVEHWNQMNVADFGVSFDETVLTFDNATVSNLPALAGVNSSNALNGSIDFGFANFSGTPVDLNDGDVILTLVFSLTGVVDPTSLISIVSTPTQTILFENSSGQINDYTLNDGSITVTDTGDPMITLCPADATIECLTPLDPALNPLLDEAVATDDCNPTGTTVSYTDDISGLTGCAFTGSILRTWTADDGNGNTTTCTQTITVEDNNGPTFTEPADVTISCSDDFTDLMITGNVTNVMDLCGTIMDTVYVDNPDPTTLTGCSASNTFIRTWTVTDECSNSSILTQTIVIDDMAPPTFDPPAAVTLECDQDVNDTVLTGVPTNIMDDCGVSAAPVFTDDISGLTGCNNTGSIIRLWTVTDICGNPATLSQTITIQDNTDPTFTVPADVTLSCSDDFTDLALTGNVSNVMDNCITIMDTVYVDNPDPTTLTGCSASNTFIRTWTVTDECSNSSVLTQTIVIDEMAPPTFDPPAAVTLECGQDVNDTVLTGVPTNIMDDCGVSAAPAFTDDIAGLTGCNNTGSIIRLWTVTDICGNPATLSQTITIQDTTDPTFTAPADVTLFCSDDFTDLALTGNVSDVMDNCTNIMDTVFVDNPDPTTLTGCSASNTFTRTWTVTDECTNSSVLTQTIVIDDMAPPTFDVPAAVTLECDQDVNDTGLTGVPTNIMDDCGVSAAPAFTDDNSGLTGCNGTGTITRLWTVTDICGNPATLSQTITIQDNTNPTALCMDMSVSLDATGNATITASDIDAGSSDNCTTPVTTSLDISSFDCTNLGPNTVILTVTDGCGLASTCSATVTVMDDIDPTITCPNDTIITLGPAETSVIVGDIGVLAGDDNCGITSATYVLTGDTNDSGNTDASGTLFNVGVTTVTYTVSDDAGNTAECSFTVSISSVSFECPNDTTGTAATGTCSEVINDIGLNITSGAGNVAEITYSLTGATTFNSIFDASGVDFNVGVTTVTYTVVDINMNSSTCSFTVTITDDEAPAITCPSDTLIIAELTETNAVVNDIALVDVSDNCPDPLVDFSLSGVTTGNGTVDASGTAFNLGITNVTYTVSDTSGNSSSCSFNVTVEPITFKCPGDTTRNVDPGLCSAIINGLDVDITSGASGIASITYQLNGATTGTDTLDASGTAFNVGITTVTYTIIDVNDNISICSFDVRIIDDETPAISCPSGGSVIADLGQITAIVNGIAPVSIADNCPDPGVNYTLSGATTGSDTLDASGTAFNIGATVVTYTVSDSSGNSNTCSFTITVEPLSYACPGDVTESATAGLCSAVINSIGLVLSSGEAGIASITYQLTGATTGTDTLDASGTAFNVGVTTVTYTIIDTNDNSQTCSFTVTITDDEDPTISCPANVSVIASAGNPNTAVNNIAPTATNDNCSVVDTSFAISGATTLTGSGDASGSLINLGANVVTYTVTDDAGNSASCSFTVTVTAGDLIDCPPDHLQNTDGGSCFATVDAIAPTLLIPIADIDTVYFSLSGATTGEGPDDASGSTFNVGVTTVTYTAEDNLGNSDVCTFTVTINDIEDPTLSCPSVDAFTNETGLCSFTVTNDLSPNANDNCGLASVTYEITGATTGSGMDDATGTAFQIGTSIVNYTATDITGNSATCSIIVVVNDGELPSISCPPNTGITADPGESSAFVNNIGLLMASDNCGLVDTSFTLVGTTLGSGSEDASGIQFNLGNTVVTYDVTDENGNTQSCSFSVFVTPDGGFNLKECPPDLTVNTDAGNCSAVVTNIAPIVLSPNLTLCTYSFSGATIGGGLTDASGREFLLGTTIIEYIGTDILGNMDTCSFSITVVDNESPVFDNCPVLVVDTVDIDECKTLVFWGEITATDNCGNVTITSSHMPGDTFELGNTTVTYFAEDDAGNMSTCTFEVIVQDHTPPVLTCPADQQLTALPGECGTIGTWFEPIPMDDCNAAMIISSTHTSGSTLPVGVNTIVLTAADDAGNQSTCSFTIEVLDEENPVINGPTEINGVTYIEDCMAVVDWTDATATDNCPGVTLQGTNSPGDTFIVGAPITITYLAIDASGNSDTYDFDFTVPDNDPPVVLDCPMDITIPVNSANCEAIVTWTPPSSDDCTDVSVSSSASPGQIFPLGGPTIVTYVFTDEFNNSTNCTFTVTVVDEALPVPECFAPIIVGIDGTVQSNPDNVAITTTASANCDAAVIEYPTPFASDDCSEPILGVQTDATGLTSGSEFPIGTTVLEYSFTDGGGNIATCELTFIVNPFEDLQVSVSPSTVCVGSTIQFNVEVIGGATYEWSGPNDFTSSEPDPSIPSASEDAAGTYTVVCTLPNGCTNTGSVDLEVSAGPEVSIGSNSPVCDDVISLTAETTGTVQSWSWRGPDGTIYDEQNPIIPGIGTEDFGIYQLTATGVNGCATTVMLTVSGAEVAEPSIDSDCGDIVCLGEPCTLFGTQFSPVPDAYTWTSSENAGLPDDTDASEIMVIPTQPGIHTYTYSVILNGCESAVAVYTLTVSGDPELMDDEYDMTFETTLENFSVVQNDELSGLDFDLLVLTTTSNGVLFDNGNGSFTYEPNQGFVGTDMFTYQVCYDCLNDQCATASVLINVEFDGDCLVPTMITPNDDGVNDVLFVGCIETGKFPDNELLVFNQWGDIVFEASPYENNWDGTFKGEPGKNLPDGTYFVLFKPDQSAVAIQTYITIFR